MAILWQKYKNKHKSLVPILSSDFNFLAGGSTCETTESDDMISEEGIMCPGVYATNL